MINFKREGETVIAEIECNVGVPQRFFHFTWRTTDQVYACLLQENFQSYLRNKMEKIRREAYEAGWKDARGKQRKATWFSGWL